MGFRVAGECSLNSLFSNGMCFGFGLEVYGIDIGPLIDMFSFLVNWFLRDQRMSNFVRKYWFYFALDEAMASIERNANYSFHAHFNESLNAFLTSKITTKISQYREWTCEIIYQPLWKMDYAMGNYYIIDFFRRIDATQLNCWRKSWNSHVLNSHLMLANP